MANEIKKTGQFIFSFFAMLVTLLSFALLSLKILFISIIWMFSRFFSHLSYKLSTLGYKWN
ncbi:hypothetical protein [sulfur-oxidizing endosymbiont of Gigantopelta aegis]|uniref:hypothetical protein n=1 Tax=sulfur-oxidizing endosymbiont of Gigantopelta aegis TaxID=2794934 RepID=UPI0018DCE97F|nr:hypothetical protein [sulfur-oxidizing endosymbiont of Gigantopelta aegis]